MNAKNLKSLRKIIDVLYSASSYSLTFSEHLEKTGLSKSTLTSALKNLEKIGVVSKTSFHVKKKIFSLYTLNIKAIFKFPFLFPSQLSFYIKLLSRHETNNFIENPLLLLKSSSEIKKLLPSIFENQLCWHCLQPLIKTETEFVCPSCCLTFPLDFTYPLPKNKNKLL